MSAILKRIGHFLLIIFAGVVSFLVPDLFSSCERFDYERVIIIETGPVIDISCISAEISGQLIDLGESDIIQHGHCWSEDANPTKDGSNISRLGSISSRGSFTSEITGLLPDTKYYVRAYATNSKGITTYGDTKSFATNADNSPKANFTASATAISIGQSVYFYDQSDNAPASWLWSFGDGESSTEQNPVHVFETTGNYTVELKASNDCGAHTASKPGYIKVQERFRDYRDGHVYRWVTIGNQVWMAENLAYLPDINPPEDYSPTIPLNYVYDYYDYNTDEAKALSNYSTYGVLYNWTAAMNGSSASSANPSGVQGICPEGWHLPSDDEWFDLIFYVGGNLEDPFSTNAGGQLKEVEDSHWNNPNIGATNTYGFTGLPGGAYYSDDASFAYLGTEAFWWSSNADTVGYSWGLTSDDANIHWYYCDKSNGHGVRCIQDDSNVKKRLPGKVDYHPAILKQRK